MVLNLLIHKLGTRVLSISLIIPYIVGNKLYGKKKPTELKPAANKLKLNEVFRQKTDKKPCTIHILSMSSIYVLKARCYIHFEN